MKIKALLLAFLISALLKGQDCVLVHGWLNDGTIWDGSGIKNLVDGEYNFNRILQPNLGGTSSASQQSLNLRDYLINNNVNNSLAISYSMGGMNTRYHLKRQYEQGQPDRINYHFTIGSPHIGAMLANNTAAAINRITIACEAALTPGGKLLGSIFTTLGIQYAYADAANYALILIFSEYLYQLIHGDGGQALNDLEMGSQADSYINHPNTIYENNIAKVGIAGVEDYPQIYRLGASGFGIPEGQALDIVNGLLAYKFFILIQDYIRFAEQPNPQNQGLLEESLGSLAAVLEFPDAWNLLVSGSTNGESDGIVQKASQIYPNYNLQYFANGANHVEEKSNSDVLNHLRDAINFYSLGLTNVIFVPADYSTIAAALSVATPGQTVNVTNSQTLTGNISVPAQVTLNFSAASSLNLNGYILTNNGGTIAVQSGATINGALLKTGGSTNAIYSSILSALNASASGQTVEVISSQTVTSNLSVQSGRSLSINSGATLTFSSGKKLSIYGGGTLTANGATFKGNGTAGNWHSISFFANSSGSIQYSTIKDAQAGVYTTTNASVTVSNNTITNNSIYGISSINNSDITISNCTISNNGTGINLSSTDAPIYGNDILNNSNYGINANNVDNSVDWYDNTMHDNGYAMLLNNASPYIYDNFITDNDHGIVITSSLPNFADPQNQWRGYNAITCNIATPNFRAENYSTVYAGYNDGGYNSIFGSELPDMEAINHSGIYAANNYWGPYSPAIYADGTSWILAWYPLGSNPIPGSECDGYRSSSSIAGNTFMPSMEADINGKYWEAIAHGRKGEFLKAKELLRLIINGNFDNKYSPLALLAFYEFILNERTDLINQQGSIITLMNELKSLLQNLNNRAAGDLLKPFAIRLLSREAALSGNHAEMVSYSNELIRNYPNSVNELTALYDLIVYYTDIENDITKAEELFSRMNKAYPDEDLTMFASINLGITSGRMLKRSGFLDQVPEEYFLSNNFPNPFNPTTLINYSILEKGHVIIKVFDILGREVADLVNEVKEKGNYSVNFDGKDLSSGIYIYTISVNNFNASRKMLLMK